MGRLWVNRTQRRGVRTREGELEPEEKGSEDQRQVRTTEDGLGHRPVGSLVHQLTSFIWMLRSIKFLEEVSVETRGLEV